MTGAGEEGRPGQGWRFLPEAFTIFLVLNLMTLAASGQGMKPAMQFRNS